MNMSGSPHIEIVRWNPPAVAAVSAVVVAQLALDHDAVRVAVVVAVVEASPLVLPDLLLVEEDEMAISSN